MEGIATVVGGFCIHLVIGTQYVWGNIAVYVTSYYRDEDPSVSLGSTAIVLPLVILVTGPFKYLGSHLSMKIGVKR